MIGIMESNCINSVIVPRRSRRAVSKYDMIAFNLVVEKRKKRGTKKKKKKYRKREQKEVKDRKGKRKQM